MGKQLLAGLVLLLVGCSGGGVSGPVDSSGRLSSDAAGHKIELLTYPGCAQTEVLGDRMMSVLAKLEHSAGFEVVQMDELSPDDLKTGYGSPTVLVNGSDLMGHDPPAEPAAPS
jgi:hypothetical protein